MTSMTNHINDQRIYTIYWCYTYYLILKMTSAKVVEMSVNVILNSPSQHLINTHPDDHTSLTLLYDSFVQIIYSIINNCLILFSKNIFNYSGLKSQTICCMTFPG